MTLTLRRFTPADLAQVESWLAEPHVARWYLQDSTVAGELAGFRDCLAGRDPTVLLIVGENGRDVGWCQWYRWWDYPAEAAQYDADDGSLGFDYALGEPDAIGRGLGTELIGLLVAQLRSRHPQATMLVGPSAANAASCRVLEKNGFARRDVRNLPDEPNASPIAVYRLPPPASVGDLGTA